MTQNTAADEALIRMVVGQINELWRAGQYEHIGNHVAAEAVIAPPGLSLKSGS